MSPLAPKSLALYKGDQIMQKFDAETKKRAASFALYVFSIALAVGIGAWQVGAISNPVMPLGSGALGVPTQVIYIRPVLVHVPAVNTERRFTGLGTRRNLEIAAGLPNEVIVQVLPIARLQYQSAWNRIHALDSYLPLYTSACFAVKSLLTTKYAKKRVSFCARFHHGHVV